MKNRIWLAGFLVAVAAMTVGCRKELLDSIHPPKDRGVSFTTHVGGVSKGVSRDRFVAGDAFEVVGYNAEAPLKDGATGVVAMPSGATLLFDQNDQYYPFKRALVRASALGDGLAWSYVPMIFWPAGGRTSFAAFSPAASKDTKITAPVATTAGVPSLSFEVFGGAQAYDPASLAAARLENIHQVDLLHAMNLDMATEPAGGVELDFRHALTKVRFSVKGAQDEGILRIVSVTLTGVVHKGSMELIYSDRNAARVDYLGGWTSSVADTLSFPMVLNSINAAAVGAGKVVSVVDDHEALLMIPQQLTGVKVHVVYAHSLDGGLTWQEYVAGDGTTELPLSTSGVPYWKPNMSVNYIMEVNPGMPVWFTAELKAWDEEQDQYVPKFEVKNGPSTVSLIELEAGDVVTTDPASTWVTIEEVAEKSRAAGVATPLDRAYTVAQTRNYLFKVKANTNVEVREVNVVITRGLGDFARTITFHVRQEGGKNYVVINNLRWAVGNLVATGNYTCAIGAPTDGGVYFQFGSLVGWTGGTGGNGMGVVVSSVALDKAVWPKELSATKPTFTWPDKNVADISTLSDYYFNYSVAPWQANTSTDIGTFAGTGLGENGPGTTLRGGRYANLGVGDPCSYYLGGTWRMPTIAQIVALDDKGRGAWLADVKGRWLGDTPGDATTSVFFPASGHRSSSNGSFGNVGLSGCCWSSSVHDAMSGYYMYFNSSGLTAQTPNGRSYCLPVRCVASIDSID